jgi:PilZ domain
MGTRKTVRQIGKTKTVWPLLWDSRMRAPRFRLDLPVHYRPLGDNEWRQATTGNISSSGLLLRAEDALPLDTRLELRVALALNEPVASPKGEVSCLGHVVRVVDAPQGDAHGFAVAIDEYAFRQRMGRA